MRNIPTVTRYLLIANFVVFFLAAIVQRYGIDLNTLCGLHYGSRLPICSSTRTSATYSSICLRYGCSRR